MKKILTILVSLSFILTINAQYTNDCAESNLALTNIVQADGNKVTFDVMIVSATPMADPCHLIYFANGQVYVKYDETKFTNPTLVLENIFTPAVSDFDNSGFGPFASNLDPSIVGTNTAALQLNQISTPNFNSLNPNRVPELGSTPMRIATLSITGYSTGDPLLSLDFTGSGGGFSGGESELDAFITKIFTYDAVVATGGTSDLFSVLSADQPLPAILTKFEANKYNRNSSVVIWQTATESNTSHFEIQRAEKGGESWTQIGEVKAEGNSTNLQSYQFVDYDVYDGKRASADFMYRLKIIDLDGKYDYSNIDEVNFGKALREGTIKTFPNPAKDGVHIQFSSDLQQKPTEVQVYDIVGKLVYSQDIAEDADYAYIDFLVAKVESGSYMVQFMANNLLIGQEKIIVQQ